MKVIFYDPVYPDEPTSQEFAGLETILFVDNRMIGTTRVDEIREDRIVLAVLRGVPLGTGNGKRTVSVFGVPDGTRTRFFRCYVIAEDTRTIGDQP